MPIPKLYNKRVKYFLPLVFSIICITFGLNFYLSENIHQFLLENNALNQNKLLTFNPRTSTLALYSYVEDIIHYNRSELIHIGTRDGIYFHWDDWVDLSPGNKFLDRYRHDFPSGQCDSVLTKYALVNGYSLESYNKKVLRGMANLYCLKDIPKKVFITTDDSMVEVPIIGKKRFGVNLLGPRAQDKDQLVESMMTIEQSKDRLHFKSKPLKRLQPTVPVDAKEFIFSPEAEIFKLQEKLNNETITQNELEYLEFLEYSNDYLVDNSDTYFKYPWITSDLFIGHSHHFAYPFFKRYISDRERQSVVHHMVRAWFQFAEMNGFISWVNYGSLLGWVYNGVNMPWDTDVDVQMPIVQLDRMGRQFNKSIILENPRYGNAKYLLEVAPTYIKQGNGRNFIDARFIDINSGLYIDISALLHSNFKPPSNVVPNQDNLSTMMVHCKNWNWHTLDELLPLRHSFFEGGSVYIPNNVSLILSRKYGPESFTTKLRFKKHNYQADISMWVPDRICKYPPPTNIRFNEINGGLTFEGACNKEYLQDEYHIIRQCSDRHRVLNQDIDRSIDYDIGEWGELPILRKDAWDYYNDINSNNVNHDRWAVSHEMVGKIHENKTKKM